MKLLNLDIQMVVNLRSITGMQISQHWYKKCCITLCLIEHNVTVVALTLVEFSVGWLG